MLPIWKRLKHGTPSPAAQHLVSSTIEGQTERGVDQVRRGSAGCIRPGLDSERLQMNLTSTRESTAHSTFGHVGLISTELDQKLRMQPQSRRVQTGNGTDNG